MRYLKMLETRGFAERKAPAQLALVEEAQLGVDLCFVTIRMKLSAWLLFQKRSHLFFIYVNIFMLTTYTSNVLLVKLSPVNGHLKIVLNFSQPWERRQGWRQQPFDMLQRWSEGFEPESCHIVV